MPRAFLANRHVRWHTVVVATTIICQRNGLSIKLFYQRVEALIGASHRVPLPGDHPTQGIHQPAQRDATAPAAFILAFFASLLWTSALTDGKNQFNRITVNDGENGWIGQEQLTPRVMGVAQPLASRSFRQSTIANPIAISSCQPAGAGANEAAFARNQDANRSSFARRHLRWWMVRNGGQTIVHQTENV